MEEHLTCPIKLNSGCRISKNLKNPTRSVKLGKKKEKKKEQEGKSSLWRELQDFCVSKYSSPSAKVTGL